MQSHHKIPRKDGAIDKYENLMFVIKDVHKLIHATTKETIEFYLNSIKKLLNNENLLKLNKLRKSIKNCKLYID
jgi:phenylalanine-4-hydroxylase